MPKLEDLSINDSAIKRIVHRHIESEIAPTFNRQSRSIKLIPFNINIVKHRDSTSIGADGVDNRLASANFKSILNHGDPSIWIGYTMKIKSSSFPDKFEEIVKSVKISYNDYITENRNQKIKSLGVTLGDKVRKNINEYIGFDSDELFPINSLVRIFGGSVRDSISDREIHDVDIILGSGSLDYVENILTQNGYKYMESLTPKDLSSIYTDIKIINEPHSWVKEDKIIQLIRPAGGLLKTRWPVHFLRDKLTGRRWGEFASDALKEIQKPDIRESIYKKSFIDLIRNVDISCCGVSYDGEKVYENYESAVSHCKNGIFIVNKEAKMYSNKRIIHRTTKLIGRGWEEVNPGVATNRDLKIDKILDEDILDYIPEYKDNI
jgi:hypothetical protein